jgi:cobalt-zinc-cadmium efflux system protein
MGHDHDRARSANQRSLAAALSLTGVFFVVELAGAFFTGSLALLSDAAHMFTDVAGLAIALIAMRIAERPPNPRKTYGYYRLEILASALNAAALFLVAFYVLWEAWRRLAEPPQILSGWMLIIAALGLITNFVSMRLLASGKETNLNVRGAYLEVWSDFLGSFGVIAGALVMMATGWLWIDSVVAILLGLWILPRTWTLLGESVNILLQGVPKGLRLDEIDTDLRAVPGVSAVHNLHVWALTSERNVMTAHIVVNAPPEEYGRMRKDIERLLQERHDLHLSTIQFEDSSGACVEFPHGEAHRHHDHRD